MKYGRLRKIAMGCGLLFGVVIFNSCIDSKELDTLSPEEFLEQQLGLVDQTKLASDIQVIEDSLELWNLTPSVLTEPEGVRYIIHEMGTGATPALRSTITVEYVGRLLSSGNTFDSGSFSTPLYNLIIGWQTTLPLLPAGTKVTLYIPSGLAYGSKTITDNAGNVQIPANSNLIFEIDLMDVK